MHFAYPPRKSSNPPPFRPRSSNLPHLRRSRLLKIVGTIVAVLVFLFWWLSGSSKPTPYHEHVPIGTPPVVVLTVIDPTAYSNVYLKTIKDNREQYAARHGYKAMVVKAYDYDVQASQQSWSKIVAMRHALTLYPDCKFLWYLDQDAYIMEMDKTLEELVLDTKKLESLMIKDHPVVPPDSIIKTFTHLKGEDAALIISQDSTGLVSNNIVIRNGEWAKFFVETWMDPLYRSYNFQKAERHALEHIVQWHPTILSKVALIPQKVLAPYIRNNLGATYQDGDFAVMLTGCTPTGEHACEMEAQHFQKKVKAKFPPPAS